MKTLGDGIAVVLVILVVALSGCAQQVEAPTVPVSEEKSPAELIAEARTLLEEAKERLEDSKEYMCCVHDPHCDWCALKEGKCGCGPALGLGDPVCPDCVAGWREGRGALEDVDPSEVRSTVQ